MQKKSLEVSEKFRTFWENYPKSKLEIIVKSGLSKTTFYRVLNRQAAIDKHGIVAFYSIAEQIGFSGKVFREKR